MTTETIDRLYLELSRVSTATTERELTARRWVARALNELEMPNPDLAKLKDYLSDAKFCLRDRFDDKLEAAQRRE